MQKPLKTMKGQVGTVTNIVGIIVGFILFFFLFLPIYQPMANTAMAALDPTWQFYTVMIILIEITPLIVIIALILYILNQSQPRYA